MPELPKKVVPEDKIYVTIPKKRETPATKGIFQQHRTWIFDLWLQDSNTACCVIHCFFKFQV